MSNGADRIHELQVEFWMKRLDHTLSHTDSSNKNIYVVDGAVLAAVYFGLQQFGKADSPASPDRMLLVFPFIEPTVQLVPGVVHVAAWPVLLLCMLNLLHARLVISQGKWYADIDSRLRHLLQQDKLRKNDSWWKKLVGTHAVYAWIHVSIAVFLAYVGYRMLTH